MPGRQANITTVLNNKKSGRKILSRFSLKQTNMKDLLFVFLGR
jgi:hypothetical protein